MGDTAVPTSAPISLRGNHSPRGQYGNFASNNSAPRTGQWRGGRISRTGRGRGRGSMNVPMQNGDHNSGRTHLDRPPGLPPDAISSDRQTGECSTSQGEKTAKTVPGEAVEEAEVCFICASTIEHTSIAPCNHQTCHICALRLRALYKTRACAHCRTEAPFVIFTDDASKRYQDFSDDDFAKIDDNLGIRYEKDEILEDTVLLLRYNCPDRDCDVACLGWPDLHRHVKTKHGKVMCDLCTRNKKVFTHEHELFSYGELRRHERFGDDNPGAIDQSGFKGHPECGFCRQRFYGDDELYNHCREKHERCHICDRRNGGQNPQYYLNYQELEKHFAEAHFVCLDAECQANKTNVFESEMDLKAHQLSAHPNGLSKDARREAKIVNLSGFDIREPYQPQRRGGRGDHRGGRGRDPNTEPLPTSSAQPIGRAELAYQRQMAIQSAQSVSTRQFGGQLTQSAPQSPRPSRQQPTNSVLEPPSLDALDLNTTTNTTSQTPQEQARALRHSAVISRATTLLHNDTTKLSTFRTHVSSYRSGTITASDLIDAIFSLFDASSSELGKLIRELADLYESDQKRQSLLEAWNNWKSINEDYPSLPGPQGTLPETSSSTINGASGGRRVLRLKSSTAQSSRSAVSRQGSWGHVLNSPSPSALVASRQTSPFPALPPTNNPSRKSTAHQNPTPWASTSIGTAQNNATNPSSTRPPTTMSSTANAEMFPSLPTAPKPSTLMAGLTRGSVRWDDRRTQAPTVNAWGAAPTPAQASAANDDVVFDNGRGDGGDSGVSPANATGKGKGKGKKGKGEVLYHFG